MTLPQAASASRSAALVLTVGIAAILLAYALLDRPLATFAHGLHRPAWCVWLTWIADVPVPASVLGLAGAGVAWLAGWRPGPAGRVLLVVCVATLAADAAKDALKLAFGRLWPETWVGHNPSWIGQGSFGFSPFHGGAGWASFPSGHMTVITAPCVALWRARSDVALWRARSDVALWRARSDVALWRARLQAAPGRARLQVALGRARLGARPPMAALPWLVAPALVMLGLLGSDYHFLSDCIAGALLGTAMGCAVAGMASGLRA